MKYHIDFSIDFRKNPYKGLYIVIEGLDGSGKSTQVENLQKYFESRGKEVIITSEPKRDLIVGQIIAQILDSKITIPSKAYQFLYTADRAVNHAKIVEPALKRGAVVISHRCFWSAIAYGVFDQGQSKYNKEITDYLFVSQSILSYYHQFIAPNYTFYLDVSMDTIVSRLAQMSKKKDIYEKREKLAKINNGYQWILTTFPDMIKRIDGEKKVEEITKNIISNLKF